ncbi:MAG TPA: Pycsar system effector family protein, partial [Phnomibacter sp.]|nr:Pycsar system effector family protein [Phnomibacter sp.]
DLNKQDRMVVHLAALYLYTGQQGEGPSDLTVASDEVSKFCTAQQVDADIIENIKDCMLGVKPPHLSLSAAGHLLCDALNSFFVEKGKLQADDLPESLQDLIMGQAQGNRLAQTQQYLERISFFTPEAKKLYEKPRQKKIAWFREKVGQIDSTGNHAGSSLEQLRKVFNDQQRLERGTETMFRIMSREHTELLAIVHQKSGFLSSINAIILSVVISVLSTKLSEFPHLIIPTLMLVVNCVTTIYFSILATKPSVINRPTGDFSSDTQNIFFFGHYSYLPWKEFRKHLRTTSSDTSELYDALAKNIYYQGINLQKKYKILARGYVIFLWGLILSVLAFIISFALV